jgi:N,N'-diacetyllegionaminate synthase
VTHIRVIAEAGVNHNGDAKLAHALVDSAADAGADVVKFQTFRSEQLATGYARKAAYQDAVTAPDESQQQMLRRLEMSRELHQELMDHCAQRGVAFLSTAFDVASVDMLVELGQREFKIPSGEITNLPYLRHVGRRGWPVLLSTGMATLAEVKDALEALEAAGTARKHVTVMQCTTSYPTHPRDANLRAMLTLKDALGVNVGFSDHTPGIDIAVAAAALGARVIEKHLTLDRSLPGPDQAASLEPAELRAMIAAIRNVELALGDGVKRPAACETANLQVARKSIVASRAVGKDEVFTADNITAKRPGDGLSPMLWDKVIGRRAKRAFAPDEQIEL